MIITVKTTVTAPAYTTGQILIDGTYLCDSLEDTTRDHNKDGDLDDPGEGKIWGQTAIPYGSYRIVLSYSPRFKKILPELVGVRHFTGIRIHPGNTVRDTHGCILPGKLSRATPGTLAGGSSRPAYLKLLQAISDAINYKEETVTLEKV